MIFPLNWKQRAVDKEQRSRSGQTTMRVSRITLDLLKKLRGNVEASDDETVYYAAAHALRATTSATTGGNDDTSRIQRAPTRPVNASDAERLRLPSERSGS